MAGASVETLLKIPWEVTMRSFVHNENVALYEKLIAESRSDLSRDENRHAMLLRLLAEEKAKDQKTLAN
ncbi:MAG TPA: hypothetical protein VKS24_03445 [Bradyrhizobium sp.]|nr:hypothetical protein [Bradyrhizobium sp.]